MDRNFARSLWLVLLVLLASCETAPKDNPGIPRDVLCSMVICDNPQRNTP